MKNNDISKMDSVELKRILTAEFERVGLRLDIDSLIIDNRRIQDGRKTIKKRHAPMLKHTKVGRFYYYDYHEVQTFVNEMIDYHDNEKPVTALQRVTDLVVFDDGEVCIDLDDEITLTIGTMYNEPTAVITTANGKTYFLTATTKGGK